MAAAEERAAQAATQQPAAAAPTGMAAAQQPASGPYDSTGQPMSCAPGQPCAQQQAAYQQQLSPAQQEEQHLVAEDRELAYASRFASNLVFAQGANGAAQITQRENSGPTAASDPSGSSLVKPKASGDPPANTSGQMPAQQMAEINIDSATGQPYVLYEGTTLGCTKLDSWENCSRNRLQKPIATL